MDLQRLKMAVFWDIAMFSLVKVDRRFWGAYYLHYQGCRENLRYDRYSVIAM
jgi:hypothetical protein